MNMTEIIEYLPLLIPVVLIELALFVIALVDLVRRKHVRGGNKIIWGIVILFGIIGPIVYFMAGRTEE